MAIKDYSTSPGSNTSISGINIAEGCPPSTINNAIRQEMADTRAQWNDAEWFQYGAGDGAATITYASATSFTIAGVDVTAEYHAGRRVRAVGTTTGTIYGTIQSSAFVTDTTVTVTWDSGSLQNESLAVSLGILRATNPSIPTGDAVRDLLGFGTMASQDADSVAITGGSATFTGGVTLESTDDGAAENPVLELYRNSPSPGNGDDLGAIHFTGANSAGGKHTFAAIEVSAATATDGAEDGEIRFQTSRGGSAPQAARAFIGAGLWMTNATGGDPGGGKINAQGYQVNGTDVFPVGRAGLKTTTAAQSDAQTVPQNSQRHGLFTLTGGQYILGIEYRKSVGNNNQLVYGYASGSPAHGTTSGTFAALFPYTLHNTESGNQRSCGIEVRHRYVQSSPPYDLGDGEVQGFVYVALRPDGTVASTYIAEDPPWYGNTAHAPREQFIKDGKPFGRFVRPVCRLCDVKAGKITLDEYRARAGEFEVIEEEITPATKLRGMEDLPQPFLTVNPDRTVVLLDPMDDLTGRLIAMMQAGESVPELFAEGYLRVDNEALKRGSPPGVPVHPVKWR